MGVLFHVFLTLVLDGDPIPIRFSAKEKTVKYLMEGGLGGAHSQSG